MRRNVEQGQQYKISLGNARVWNDQIGFADLTKSVGQNIQIQMSRPPVNRRLPPVLPFDVLQPRQQFAGLQLGQDPSHGINLVRLVRRPHGRILVQSRRRQKAGSIQRFNADQRRVNVLDGITEVTADSDTGGNPGVHAGLCARYPISTRGLRCGLRSTSTRSGSSARVDTNDITLLLGRQRLYLGPEIGNVHGHLPNRCTQQHQIIGCPESWMTQ